MSYEKTEGQESISYQALLDEIKALKDENQSLRERLAESEELKRAISEGDLDALVVPRPEGELVFTLDSTDSAYRVLVETMNEGTATLAFDGTILYCNRRFAELLNMPSQSIVGTSIYQFIAPESTVNFNAFLKHKMNTGEINLKAGDGNSLPVYLSISSLKVEGSPNAWCLVVTDLTDQKKNEEIIASERLASSIIEQAAETIAVCDTSGRIIRFSNSMPKFCGCAPTFQRFEDIMNLQFAEGEDKGESILPVSSALKGYTILDMEAIYEPKNQRLHLLLNSGPLKNDDGRIIGCVVTFTDITERKKTEDALQQAYEEIQIKSEELQASNEELQAQSEELQTQTEELQDAYETLIESEKRYRMLFENMSEGFFLAEIIYDQSGKPVDYRHLAVNPALERVTGMKPEDLVGKTRLEVITKPSPWIEIFEKVALSGQPETFEDFSAPLNRHYSITVYPPKLGQFACLVQDITERKKAEAKLKETLDHLEEKVKERTVELEKAYNSLKDSDERFRVAVKNSSLVLSQFDLDLRYTWIYNPHPDFNASMLIGKRGDELEHSDEMRRFTALKRQVLESGKGIHKEISFSRSDGVHTYDIIIEPLYNDTGDVIGGTVSGLDVTERKKAEEALAKIEIARKKEIHHRIKNNLQVISSLLDLQAEQFRDKECIKDLEVLEAFRESQDRVISMALIHEELYKGGGFETLNFAPYIHELVENLFQTYRLGNTDINLKLDLAENAFFDMDIAVPLGMIVNELVSNSFKHAFIGRDEGEIRIKLCREESSEFACEDCESTSFTLTISDNGIGIPEDLDIEDLDSLGMQLVTSLVDQLDGEFELKRNNGTEFTMRFTVKENNSSASMQVPQLIE